MFSINLLELSINVNMDFQSNNSPESYCIDNDAIVRMVHSRPTTYCYGTTTKAYPLTTVCI